MYNIVLSVEAKQDLQNIYDYIDKELQNPLSAQNIIDSIKKAIQSLEEYPLRGILMGKFSSLLAEYRCILSGNYVIVYRVDESSVFILRIYNKRQDNIKALLL